MSSMCLCIFICVHICSKRTLVWRQWPALTDWPGLTISAFWTEIWRERWPSHPRRGERVCQGSLVPSVLLTSYISRSLRDRWGTTEDLTANFLHPSLSSASLKASPSFRPVHSRMLSSHLFLCLPLALCPCTVPCKIVPSVISWKNLLWKHPIFTTNLVLQIFPRCRTWTKPLSRGVVVNNDYFLQNFHLWCKIQLLQNVYLWCKICHVSIKI